MAMGPVAIVGVGMMGGSLGLALTERAGVEVRGWDADADALAEAGERGAVVPAPSLDAAIADAKAVFLAAPVGRLAELAGDVLASSGPDVVVSDLGSAKAAVVAPLGAGQRDRFIGGHPICGNERAGVGAARSDLFAGATWFLTPSPEAEPTLLERLHRIIASVGARPVAIDPGVHDDLMAIVSHLPHALAGALMAQAADTAPEGREALRSAGPSFSDLTRIAGANPPMWADILIANRGAVLAALGDYAGRLADVAEALENRDRDWVERFFATAAAGRSRLLDVGGEDGDAPWQLIVAVPDRPGAISEIVTVLGHAHINIDDLTLRPGDGAGELDLLLAGEDAASAAQGALAERGFAATLGPVG